MNETDKIEDKQDVPPVEDREEELPVEDREETTPDTIDDPDMEMVFDYIFNAFYYEVLKFCGCGCPPEMMMTLLDLLECFTIDEDDDRLTVPYFGFTGEKLFQEKFRTEDPRLIEFMVKYLDSLGLCEHGTSWHGSWLTSKGKTYRELLRRCKEREFEEI
jgi:hypothetical protein